VLPGVVNWPHFQGQADIFGKYMEELAPNKSNSEKLGVFFDIA